MIEPNIYDKVVDRLHEVHKKVQDKLHSQFASTRPFRTEELPNEDLFVYYNQLTDDDMLRLVQRHGEDVVNDFIMRMEQFRQRRKLNA